MTIALPAQRARLDARRGRVLVSLASSAPGLCQVVVSAHGRPIAQRLVALLHPGRQQVSLPLTSAGRRRLRGHSPVALRVTATIHDLLAEAASARIRASLR
jgi:hypothetical protein